jgi:hypothetical protein
MILEDAQRASYCASCTHDSRGRIARDPAQVPHSDRVILPGDRLLSRRRPLIMQWDTWAEALSA